MSKGKAKVKVNGEEVGEQAVRFELDRLVRFYQSHGMSEDEIKKSLPELVDKAIDQAIGAKLLVDMAKKLDLRVSEEELDAEVAKVVSQVGGEENFRRALAAQGLDDEAFREKIATGVKVNKLVANACSGVPEPTEDEVEAFCRAQGARYAANGEGDVREKVKDLLRHEARGRAMDAYIAELRESATIEYSDGRHDCGCGHCH